jgi:ActR/RegA family two-component response regulator
MNNSVLLIDDEPLVARAVARLLRRDGYMVTAVHDERMALACTGSFEVAVIDLHLAHGLGTAAAAALLSSGAVRRVVFFSGERDGEAATQAAKLGPVISKDADELRAMLAQWCAPARAAAG